jgi:hypothetical protein
MIGTFAKDELEEACRTTQAYARIEYTPGSDITLGSNVKNFGAPTCYVNIDTAFVLNPA